MTTLDREPEILADAGLESWYFADDNTERLRYPIDPVWYGENPRAYLYEADGKRFAHSGVLTAGVLADWAR